MNRHGEKDAYGNIKRSRNKEKEYKTQVHRIFEVIPKEGENGNKQ